MFSGSRDLSIGTLWGVGGGGVGGLNAHNKDIRPIYGSIVPYPPPPYPPKGPYELPRGDLIHKV